MAVEWRNGTLEEIGEGSEHCHGYEEIPDDESIRLVVNITLWDVDLVGIRCSGYYWHHDTELHQEMDVQLKSE